MNVVVTGANGFVGRNLVKKLAENNKVIGIVRNRDNVHEELKSQNVEIIECNMNEYDTLILKLQNYKEIDIIYHLAWESAASINKADYNTQLNNVKNSCELLKVASKLNIKRFLYAGTIAEYEYMNTINNNFYDVSINCIYSIAKMSARYMLMTMCANYNIDFLPVTISNIYGAGEESNRFFISVLRKMLRNEEINLTLATQLHDFIYVTDAVNAIALVGEKGQKNTNYYIGNREPKVLKEFLEDMKKITNSKSNLSYGAIEYKNIPIDFKQFEMKRVYDEFNFKTAISFEEGVKLVLKWLDKTSK